MRSASRHYPGKIQDDGKGACQTNRKGTARKNWDSRKAAKLNEKGAIPQLLATLAQEDSIVAIGAVGTQPDMHKPFVIGVPAISWRSRTSSSSQLNRSVISSTPLLARKSAE